MNEENQKKKRKRMRLRRKRRDRMAGKIDSQNELQRERECKNGVNVKPKPNYKKSCLCVKLQVSH